MHDTPSSRGCCPALRHRNHGVEENNREKSEKDHILLQEALSSQIPAWDDSNTVISSASVDLSRDVVKSYRHFDEETYKSCQERLPKNDDEVMQYDYSDLIATAKTLKEEKLPLYRCAEIILQ